MANGGQLLTVEEYAEKFFLKFLKVCLSLYFFTGAGGGAGYRGVGNRVQRFLVRVCSRGRSLKGEGCMGAGCGKPATDARRAGAAVGGVCGAASFIAVSKVFPRGSKASIVTCLSFGVGSPSTSFLSPLVASASSLALSPSLSPSRSSAFALVLFLPLSPPSLRYIRIGVSPPRPLVTSPPPPLPLTLLHSISSLFLALVLSISTVRILSPDTWLYTRRG